MIIIEIFGKAKTDNDIYHANQTLIRVPGIVHFSDGIATSIRKIKYIVKSLKLYWLNLAWEKSQNRYRKNLVPKKSTGIGIVNIWYRKSIGFVYRHTLKEIL